jgi:hypothetical protein
MSDVPVWTLAVGPALGGMLAIAGGWLQSWLTRRRDRAESLWDRKSQAYVDGMYALDVASMAAVTRRSPDPDKVGSVNREEELLRAKAVLHIFGTDRAVANFDAAVALILTHKWDAVSLHTNAFKMAAHRDLGLEEQSGRRPTP